VVAIKEARGSVDQVARIVATTDITVLSGDDSLTLPMLAVGARGVVSVAANVVPGEVVEMVSAFLGGSLDKARALHLKLLPLMHVLFLETNPGPVKAALEMIGHGTGDLRLPLVGVSEASRQKVKRVLQDLKVL
jgi:4-hydroxy-tetrahydrodipicolinate synthase